MVFSLKQHIISLPECKGMKNALIIYPSSTGNTEKMAQVIKLGLEEAGIQVTVNNPELAGDVDYFKYDLVCIGSPSIRWHPTK
jgi:flavodoxin